MLLYPEAVAALVTEAPVASRVRECCNRSWLRHCGKVIVVSARNSLLSVRSDAPTAVPSWARVRGSAGFPRPQGVLAVLCLLPIAALALGAFPREPAQQF